MSAKPLLPPARAAVSFVAVVLALAVAGVIALAGGRALAVNVSCGDTITADTTLHQNLVACPHNGIIIGADDITLDLNGHTIDGDGISSPTCECAVWSQGHDGVTVTNGSVREFDAGVELESASHNRLLGVSASRNTFNGIVFFKCTRCLVRNSSGRHSANGKDTGSGISLFNVRHSRILDNSFRRNRDHGIFVYRSTHNLIKGNLTSGNKGEGGIVLERSDRNRVRRNRSVRDGTGVFVPDGSRNVIARNRIAHPIQGKGGDGQGVEIPRGDHNVIAHNSIRDTVQQGILVAFDEGVGNVVSRNHVRDAGRNGIYVGDGAKDTNVVRRNHIRDAGEDGVRVVAGAKHTLLKHNHAVGARDDGLDVNSPTTKLTGNEARRNGDLGIEAVRGVIDGGGNLARHNGDPRQCTNLVCN